MPCLRPRGGGSTLGISGWGCAAGILDPLTYTRASTAKRRLKEVSNELIDLKASHAALLAANNEITNELTALRNDVTSHLQTQSQRLTEQPTNVAHGYTYGLRSGFSRSDFRFVRTDRLSNFVTHSYNRI